MTSEDHHKHLRRTVTGSGIGHLTLRLLPRPLCYRPIDVGKHLPQAPLAERGYLVVHGRGE